MNLTGLERSWAPIRFQLPEYQRDIERIQQAGYQVVRIPISFTFANASTNPYSVFTRSAQRKLLRLFQKAPEGMVFVVALFDGGLTNANHTVRSQEIATWWQQWASFFRDIPSDRLYFEIYNEPTIDPWRWEEAARTIVQAIRSIDSERPLIVGATNFNSMYELTRSKPLPYEHLIYTFHFYEPFLFTHQGASWIGNQVATTGIPFPYDPERMPPLAPGAQNTEGENNYRDYPHTGTPQALEDKVAQVASWAKEYGVRLWCTEFGSIQTADADSRCRYHQAMTQTLKKYGIPGFVWEYAGNFGVSASDTIPDCYRCSPQR